MPKVIQIDTYLAIEFEKMGPTIYQYNQPFTLECGVSLPKLKIAYHTYGEYTPGKKVAWVCHALTANSDAADWWKGLIGEGYLINPNDYFIVCANIIGSCYGSTGPLSVEDLGTEISLNNFPTVTIRDMVQAHILLRQHLGIDTIDLLMGGSMGGYQALEWAIFEPTVIKKMFLISLFFILLIFNDLSIFLYSGCIGCIGCAILLSSYLLINCFYRIPKLLT